MNKKERDKKLEEALENLRTLPPEEQEKLKGLEEETIKRHEENEKRIQERLEKRCLWSVQAEKDFKTGNITLKKPDCYICEGYRFACSLYYPRGETKNDNESN